MVWVELMADVWISQYDGRCMVVRIGDNSYVLSVLDLSSATYPTLEAAQAAAEFLTNL